MKTTQVVHMHINLITVQERVFGIVTCVFFVLKKEEGLCQEISFSE